MGVPGAGPAAHVARCLSPQTLHGCPHRLDCLRRADGLAAGAGGEGSGSTEAPASSPPPACSTVCLASRKIIKSRTWAAARVGALDRPHIPPQAPIQIAGPAAPCPRSASPHAMYASSTASAATDAHRAPHFPRPHLLLQVLDLGILGRRLLRRLLGHGLQPATGAGGRGSVVGGPGLSWAGADLSWADWAGRAQHFPCPDRPTDDRAQAPSRPISPLPRRPRAWRPPPSGSGTARRTGLWSPCSPFPAAPRRPARRPAGSPRPAARAGPRFHDAGTRPPRAPLPVPPPRLPGPARGARGFRMREARE